MRQLIKMIRGSVGLTVPVKRPASSRERGSSLVEATLVAFFVLIPLLVGVVDFGRAYFYSIEIANAATAGAEFGAQNTGASMINASGIKTAAQNEAPDIATTCTSTPGACWVSGYPLGQWGCECSGTATAGGGTNSCSLSASACTHLVNFVVVTAQATYTPLFSVRGLFPPITLSSQAKVRLAAQ